jgi:hypothetical protein
MDGPQQREAQRLEEEALDEDFGNKAWASRAASIMGESSLITYPLMFVEMVA